MFEAPKFMSADVGPLWLNVNDCELTIVLVINKITVK